MKKAFHQLSLTNEFKKFVTASYSGRRRMTSGKKLRSGTITQYECVLTLLCEFEQTLENPVHIELVHRASLRTLRKVKNYWDRFFKQFSQFLYRKKGCFDQYVGSVFKIVKTFFKYLALEKALPVGDFYKKFKIPDEKFTPVILTPSQLNFLITNNQFEKSLSAPQKRVKDIFVFGCTVALRYQDLMKLRKENIQVSAEGNFITLNTQKTGSEVKIPLPDYALHIVQQYKWKAGNYLLPRLSSTNLNLGVKLLMKKAGWDHNCPKLRQKEGKAVEIKTTKGESFKFYDHITAHTMRRTAITTLLLMGVDEHAVRRISGHAPGSKEFYRYVVIVQDYLNSKVKAAHLKLINYNEFEQQKVA